MGFPIGHQGSVQANDPPTRVASCTVRARLFYDRIVTYRAEGFALDEWLLDMFWCGIARRQNNPESIRAKSVSLALIGVTRSV